MPDARRSRRRGPLFRAPPCSALAPAGTAMKIPDPYAELGLAIGASDVEIKRAYRRLVSLAPGPQQVERGAREDDTACGLRSWGGQRYRPRTAEDLARPSSVGWVDAIASRDFSLKANHVQPRFHHTFSNAQKPLAPFDCLGGVADTSVCCRGLASSDLCGCGLITSKYLALFCRSSARPYSMACGDMSAAQRTVPRSTQ